jgi:signal transduction histidine kinase
MSAVHRERHLELRAVAAPHATFHGACRDLEEMIGNLLDNACKWARASVSVVSRLEGGQVVVEVHDDGPGMDEAAMARAFAWGERLDETRAGEGFGLAIVRELAEGYGGEATLSPSSLGGLQATLRLPAQAAGGS